MAKHWWKILCVVLLYYTIFQGLTGPVPHLPILEESIRAIDALNPEERTFGSLTSTVRREQLADLKEEINRFGQHLLSKYGTSEPVEGEVMRLNIQLYPLTKKRDGNE